MTGHAVPASETPLDGLPGREQGHRMALRGRTMMWRLISQRSVQNAAEAAARLRLQRLEAPQVTRLPRQQGGRGEAPPPSG